MYLFIFIYLLLAALSLGSYKQAFSLVEASGDSSLVVVHGLLIAVASLVAEHRL